MKKLLLLLPLFLGLQNCGKKVTVKDKNATTSPASNSRVKITSDWSPLALNDKSMNIVVGKNFSVDQAQGEYVMDDSFNFTSSTQLKISEKSGASLYFGSTLFSTSGSFQLREGSARGRVFMLRNAYQKGSQIKLYFEYYNYGSDTESEYYDGYLTMVSQ